MTVPNRANDPARKIGDHTSPLNKAVGFVKEVFGSSKKQSTARGERIDAQRGIGTYTPNVTSGPPLKGFGPNNSRETFERRANTNVPGIDNSIWKSMRDVPGSGQR